MKHSWKVFSRFVALTVLSGLIVGCGGAPNSDGSGGTNSGSSSATISFESNSDSDLALRGQGGEEAAVVTFTVTDVGGNALSGVNVNFELSSDIGGVKLLGDTSAQSDSSGFVSAIVQSGVFPVSVYVLATIDGTSTVAVSDEVSVSTSTFVASDFPLTAIITDSVRPQAGFVSVEEAGSLAGITVQLQLIARDQFGHKVFDGARITLLSPETGLFEPSTCTLTGGICQTTWTSTDSGIEGTFVTLLAYANGAEEFLDINSNSIYEVGEEFVDLGEAYVDENESGSYDLGELFIDNNGNESYDVTGNGVWDGPCIPKEGEDDAAQALRCAGNTSTVIWDDLVLRLDASVDD